MEELIDWLNIILRRVGNISAIYSTEDILVELIFNKHLIPRTVRHLQPRTRKSNGLLELSSIYLELYVHESFVLQPTSVIVCRINIYMIYIFEINMKCHSFTHWTQMALPVVNNKLSCLYMFNAKIPNFLNRFHIFSWTVFKTCSGTCGHTSQNVYKL